MSDHPNELPIPPIAADDSRAVELVRVWAAQKNQHVSLATGLWKDAASWGVMLVDLAQHIANAYEQSTGESRERVLERIKEGFDAEWNNRTDRPTGRLMR